MLSSLEDDALEIVWGYISIAVFVEKMESLPYPLALKPTEHLRELRICHVMPAPFPSVKGCPLAVPVKRYAVFALIEVV